VHHIPEFESIGLLYAHRRAMPVTVGPIGWMLLWTLIFSIAWVRRDAPEREASGVVAAAI
jgi:hypothetical protein